MKRDLQKESIWLLSEIIVDVPLMQMDQTTVKQGPWGICRHVDSWHAVHAFFGANRLIQESFLVELNLM